MENCFYLSMPEEGLSEQSVKSVPYLINTLRFTIFWNVKAM